MLLVDILRISSLPSPQALIFITSTSFVSFMIFLAIRLKMISLKKNIAKTKKKNAE